jgi:hypothetical protein
MQVYTEVLPGTKSSANNALQWTPGEVAGAGLLVVHTARASVCYRVTEFATDWGRGFHLAKDGTPGSDTTSESYDVLCTADPRGRRCDCKGFTFGRGKPASTSPRPSPSSKTSGSEPTHRPGAYPSGRFPSPQEENGHVEDE